MGLWLDLLKTVPGWVAVSLTVYDQTEGYHRKEHQIPVRRFKELTGLSRTGIYRAIRHAEARGTIAVKRSDPKEGLAWSRKVPAYTMNPVTEWLPRTAKVVNTKVTTKVDNSGATTSIEGKETQKHTQSVLAVANTGVTRSRQQSKTTNSDLIDTLIDTPIYNSPTPVSPSLDDGLTTPPLASKSHRDEVLDYLRNHSRCGLCELSEALRISYANVQMYLNSLKKAGLANNPQRGQWEAVSV